MHNVWRWIVRPTGFIVCSLLLNWAWATPAQAQTPTPAPKNQECKTNIAELLEYKIRKVKVRARYLPPIPLPSAGEQFTPEKEFELMESVQQALQAEGNRENVEGATEFQVLNTLTVGKGQEATSPASGNAPSFAFRLFTTCKKVVKEAECKSALGETNGKCLDLIVHVRSLRFDPNNLWQDLLPNPRTDKPTFMSNVPGLLRAFNPQVGVDHDRDFGLTQRFEVSSNLLDLSKNLQGEPLEVSNTRLDLKARGRKSLHQNFYTTDTSLTFSYSPRKLLDTVALETGFTANHEPRGGGSYLKTAAVVGGSLKFRVPGKLVRNLTVGGRYRWSSNRFAGDRDAVSELTSEDAFEARVIADGSVAKGFIRSAFWMDTGKPDKMFGRYQRLAGMVGYEKEFPVALNQTVGVEVMFGVGRAWGDVPEYARFYGGNSAKNFIYESQDSPLLASLPTGPVLRSFGHGQTAERTSNGTLQGATSYQHLNMSVSIPVPRWSYPLIPNIDISIPQTDTRGRVVLDEDGNETEIDRPLKDVVKLQAENSIRILKRMLVRQGLTEQQAEAKATKEMGGIRNLVGFLADQANIYSVKPLVMFDAANLASPLPGDSRTRIAVGGGLQLTVVVAKFEVGYMRTVRRAPGDQKGNIVMSLVFQNLF